MCINNPSLISDSQIASVTMDITSTLSFLSVWKAHKVGRNVNFRARVVANWTATHNFILFF
jgi:hypothetical protein